MIRDDIETRNAFLHTLDWLLAVMERYHSPLSFGLVLIAYGNKNELGEAYGAQEAVRQLALITDSLKHAFRKTDMIGRNGTDFWVLVPYTPASERINDKILAVIQAAQHQGLNIVDREVSIFALPLNLGEENAHLRAIELLDHLKQNRKTCASHIFTVSAVAE